MYVKLPLEDLIPNPCRQGCVVGGGKIDKIDFCDIKLLNFWH